MATGLYRLLLILTFIIGFGAITLVATNPAFLDPAIAAQGGTGGDQGRLNMAAIHLASAVGGNLFLGFISAVAFATILAVVSGLSPWRARPTISHDLFATVIRRGKVVEQAEMRVWKIATVSSTCWRSCWASFSRTGTSPSWWASRSAIADSGAIPGAAAVDLLARPDNAGRAYRRAAGPVSAVIMVVLSPAVWVVDHGPCKGSAPFPYNNPALFSMTIAFVGIWLFSVLGRERRGDIDRNGFDAQFVRCQTGIGASSASSH